MDSEQFWVDKESYREAMSCLGAAVILITTAGVNGDGGLTASAVCSVTDSPPTLLVYINRGAKLNTAFKENGNLCVNVLAHRHQELSPTFANQGDVPMAERFGRTNWLRIATGAPALDNAAAVFDCEIDEVIEVGPHSVFFCGVKAVRVGSVTSGLIHHGRTYHKVHRRVN